MKEKVMELGTRKGKVFQFCAAMEVTKGNTLFKKEGNLTSHL